jgi:hypothetical protein
MKRTLLVLMAVLAVLAFASIASADSVTYTLGIGNVPNVPADALAPYGSVTVTLQSSTSALFEYTTLAPAPLSATNDANDLAGHSYTFIDGSSVAANINATTFTVGSITAKDDLSNTLDGNYTAVTGFQNLDGFGRFNLAIDGPNDTGAANDTDFLSFIVTGTNVNWLTASDVTKFALTPNGDTTTYLVGAHVDPDWAASHGSTFFVVNGSGPSPIPLPPSALLLGSGLLGLLGLGYRQRKTKV